MTDFKLRAGVCHDWFQTKCWCLSHYVVLRYCQVCFRRNFSEYVIGPNNKKNVDSQKRGKGVLLLQRHPSVEIRGIWQAWLLLLFQHIAFSWDGAELWKCIWVFSLKHLALLLVITFKIHWSVYFSCFLTENVNCGKEIFDVTNYLAC